MAYISRFSREDSDYETDSEPRPWEMYIDRTTYLGRYIGPRYGWPCNMALHPGDFGFDFGHGWEEHPTRYGRHYRQVELARPYFGTLTQHLLRCNLDWDEENYTFVIFPVSPLVIWTIIIYLYMSFYGSALLYRPIPLRFWKRFFLTTLHMTTASCLLSPSSVMLELLSSKCPTSV